MPISDFEDMMGSSVTVAPLTGKNNYGKPTYGTTVTYKARISYRNRWLRQSDRQEVLSRGEVWTNGVTPVANEDQLTLPAGSPGPTLTPPILDVQQPQDEDGNVHHTKIIFG